MRLTFIDDDLGTEHHVLDVIPDHLPSLIESLQRVFPREFPFGRCTECGTYAVEATLHDDEGKRICTGCAAQLQLPRGNPVPQGSGSCVGQGLDVQA